MNLLLFAEKLDDKFLDIDRGDENDINVFK